MYKHVLTAAILAAVGLGSAQAQTPPAADTRTAPPAAMQATAPGGADAGKLLGRNVKNHQNETIGEIKSIHLDNSGKVDGVIVSVGGFLGIGDREVLLNWRDLQVEANGEVVRINTTKDQLKAMAPYNYRDPSYRGTVFSERGVWRDDAPARVERTDRPARTDMATAPVARDTAPAMRGTAWSGADARKLLDRNVKNHQNETIGEIEAIHLDNSGKVDGVIVSVGGFLGIGEREVLLKWADLQIENNGEVVRVNATKDQLKAMSAYSYRDPSYKGTVFSDRGVWRDDAPARVERTDRPARTDTAAATPPASRDAATTTTRSTGDFDVHGNMSTEALIGTNVKNAANETVGEIEDVYLDNNGAAKLVVVSVGGFLGLGAKDVAVPWTDLKFGRDGTKLVVTTNWTKDSLKAMPDFKNERREPASATTPPAAPPATATPPAPAPSTRSGG